MNLQFFNKWLTFNQHCPLCDIHPAVSAGPCPQCQQDLPRLLQACPRCALPGSDSLCNSCQQHAPSYSRAFAGFNYRFPLPQLIHRVKTGRDPEPLHWLSTLLAQQVSDKIDLHSTLVPVPMHPWDQTLRGFNQSQILTRNLAAALQLRVAPGLLVKTRRTEHQAALNRKQRRANLTNCYAIEGPLPQTITLIDDVMTTGTTAERLSAMLLEAGCREVSICVLCRTPE